MFRKITWPTFSGRDEAPMIAMDLASNSSLMP